MRATNSSKTTPSSSRKICGWFDSARKVLDSAVLFLVYLALAVVLVWHLAQFVVATIQPAQAAPLSRTVKPTPDGS